jgi:hypothetical protein
MGGVRHEVSAGLRAAVPRASRVRATRLLLTAPSAGYPPRGLRESVHVPKLAKAFDVQQGRDGGPADFLSRLKDQMTKYAGLNIGDSPGTQNA